MTVAEKSTRTSNDISGTCNYLYRCLWLVRGPPLTVASCRRQGRGNATATRSYENWKRQFPVNDAAVLRFVSIVKCCKPDGTSRWMAGACAVTWDG
jgi:hypothetical protein